MLFHAVIVEQSQQQMYSEKEKGGESKPAAKQIYLK
jgi:hypothetical protein